MGSKGNQVKSQSTNTYTPNAAVGAAGNQAIDMATTAASQPFQMPVAPVAGFNPFQQQAFGQIQGMQGMSQPYFDMGQQYLQGSAAPVSGQDVANYYNPMASNVTAQMQNIFGQQNLQNTGQLTQAAGGVGADRIAVGQGNMANQQGLAAGQTYAGLYQQALQAAQQNKQMQAGAGYGIAQMGPAAQSAYLQGTGALGQAGGQQQQQTQAELNAPYANTLAKIAYPYQQAQFLSGITGGLAPALGGTSQGQSTTTYPTPSPLSQIAGLGMAGAGMAMGMPGLGMGSLGKGAMSGMANMQGQAAPSGSQWNYMPGYGNYPMMASGGGVEPDDYGRGFAYGGSDDPVTFPRINSEMMPAINDYAASGDSPPQPYPESADSYGSGSFPSPENVGEGYAGMGATPSRGRYPMANPEEESFSRNLSATAGQPQVAPGIPLPPSRPTIPSAPALPSMQSSQRMPSRGGVYNRDMSVDMPDSQRPYPGAREKNWGTEFARSPWSSLVSAGVKVATTTGPIGSALASGIGAGMGHLDQQRKSLESEEGINQRAQALYQSAKQHLDKYQRKTPHELATESFRNQSLALSKYTPVTYTDAEGKSHVGVFDTKRGIVIDPQTRQPVAAANVIQRPQSDIEGRINQRAKLYMNSVPPMSPEDALARARSDIAGPMNQNTAAAKPTPSPGDIEYVKNHPEIPGLREKFIARFGVEP